MALSELELKNFEQMFNPRSVAVVGATDSPERVGFLYLESLLDGGFEGKIYPVHPRHKTLLGRKVYPSIEDVPDPVDLVIIALNQKITAQVMETCGRRGVKGVVCPAGGYKEMGEVGSRLESELASIARKHGMILIGPNTLGMSNAEARLNATFYPEKLPPGSGISVVSQSGGTGRAIIEELRDEGLGVSKWIGAGNRATIDFPECLQFLSRDRETRVIALFIEGTEKGRELMDEAARISHKKPIVVFKAANSALAQSSAVTHTGSMISSPRLFTEACRQFGLVEVVSVSELVSVAKALTLCPPPPGNGIGVVTHTAGPSIIMMDILSSRGCDLATFSGPTMSLLEDKFHGIEVVLKNPLDAAAFGYTAHGYGEVAEIVMADQDVGLLIAIHALHKRLQYAVPQLIALRKETGKPVIACYISTRDGRSDFRIQLQDAGIPFFTSIERAAWAAAGCMNYKRIIDGKGTR